MRSGSDLEDELPYYPAHTFGFTVIAGHRPMLLLVHEGRGEATGQTKTYRIQKLDEPEWF